MLNLILSLMLILNVPTKEYHKEGISKSMAIELSILSNDGDRIPISDEDVALLQRCVMSEAGNQSVQAQEAVATVILNRWMNPDKYPDTIEGVIMEKDQFSIHDNGEPTVSVRLAVHDTITYYNTVCQDIPKQCYYFRSFHYHDFGIPYVKYGDLYFSLAEGAVVD